jgi:hypothetical protein
MALEEIGRVAFAAQPFGNLDPFAGKRSLRRQTFPSATTT